MKSPRVTARFALLICLLANAPLAQAQGDPTYAEVAPILAQRCVLCHSGATPPLGLRLDSFDAVVKGSDKGPVAKAGAPADSELVRRIKGISQPRMPMTGPPFLSDAEIATLERWIAGGMKRGAEVAASSPAPDARPEPGGPVTYLHVAPIFATRCAKCHTDKGLMGPPPEGYRLTSYDSTLSPADRVRVVPGNPNASELVRRIRGQSQPRMPFDGPPYLSAEEIQLIETWIAQGARDSGGKPGPIPVGARVRLEGVLDAQRRLDGLELVIGPGTRIDKNPRAGDYVEMRGQIDAAGRVVVERLRRR